MKKLIGIALVVALAVMLMPGAVFAWDPVSVEVNWGGGAFDAGGYPVDFGAGYIGATITAQDDATSTFRTSGANILGTFTSTYTENTAYPYMGVNTLLNKINADVGNGYIEFYTDRLDSYEGSYGNPGDWSYNLVVTDGVCRNTGLFLL